MPVMKLYYKEIITTRLRGHQFSLSFGEGWGEASEANAAIKMGRNTHVQRPISFYNF